MLQVFVGDGWNDAGHLVFAALQRSFGLASATLRSQAEFEPDDIAVLVAPNPHWRREELPRKSIIFGALPPQIANELAVKSRSSDLPLTDQFLQPAPPHGMAETRLAVTYRASPLLDLGTWRRPFRRYDFADEWNNLGYGAIATDGSEWSTASSVLVNPSSELAFVTDDTGINLGSYAALFDRSDMSILWFNRVVGPLDSFEWRLIETFVSSYRHADLPTAPAISELPTGYDSLIAARLDCDEDIQSAATLVAQYDDLGLPLSLALLTNILPPHKPPEVVTRLAGREGALLSHSVSHAPSWGGSFDAALTEARSSADAIESAVGIRPRYAVSPFHQTPAFALKALEEAAYLGCVGGSISTDPSFNLARGGVVSGRSIAFVGATMQCMLHGDCLLDEGDPMAVYKAAFDLAHQSRSIFGYLDHPFSSRYQYGWADEGSRLEAHRKLIDHIQSRASRPLFVTVGTALDFLRKRSSLRLLPESGRLRVHLDDAMAPHLGITLEHRGMAFSVASGDFLP